MTPDIDEIERRAKAATPGEWTDRQDRTVAAEGVPIIRCYAWRNTADNAAHIAGMSPAATLALVARIRALEADRDRAAHLANEWADMATNGIDHLRNLRAGISTPTEALKNMLDCLAHCRAVEDPTP